MATTIGAEIISGDLNSVVSTPGPGMESLHGLKGWAESYLSLRLTRCRVTARLDAFAFPRHAAVPNPVNAGASATVTHIPQ